MKKEVFTITKFNRANGTFYYECTVGIEEDYVPKTLIEKLKNILNPKKTEVVECYVYPTGGIQIFSAWRYQAMEEVLDAINQKVIRREQQEGEKVVSTEIQVIIK
jgi:NADPH-dependent 7-cyano-7-deazaguanine reductase QueF